MPPRYRKFFIHASSGLCFRGFTPISRFRLCVVVIGLCTVLGFGLVVHVLEAVSPRETRVMGTRNPDPVFLHPGHLDVLNFPGSAFRPPIKCTSPTDALAPLVTVLVPVYNSDCKLLSAAVGSLNRQTLKRLLVHIGDDGSELKSVRPCLSALSQTYPFLRAFHRSHQGVVETRNFLLQSTQTPYFLFLDSDDLLEPTFLEKTVWFLETHLQFAIAGGSSFGFGHKRYIWTHGWHEGGNLFSDNFATITQLVRTQAARAVGLFDPAFGGGNEDWHMWMKLAAHGFWGFTIPEALSWYRTRAPAVRAADWPNLYANREASRRELQQQFSQARYHLAMPEVTPFSIAHHHIVVSPPFINTLVPLEAWAECSILLAVPWIVMGGADKLSLLLAEQLTMRRCRVTVVCDIHDPSSSRVSDMLRFTEDIHFLPAFVKPSDFLAFHKYLIESRKIERIIINNSRTAYALSASLKRLFPSLVIVAYCHMWETFWKDGGYARFAAEKLQVSALDHIFVSHHHLRSQLLGLGLPQSQVTTAYLGVHVQTPPSRLYSNSVVPASTVKVKIYFVGRLTAQKRPLLFVETVALLRDLADVAEFHMLGDGELGHAVRTKVHDLQLDTMITVHGSVSFDEVPAHLSRGDILFLPSRNEGIALVLYEAMLFGMVPVVSDVGGHSEVVTSDCECGFALPYQSDSAKETRAYGQVLRRLVGDPSVLREMSQKAPSRARLFDQAKLIPHLTSAILDVSVSSVKWDHEEKLSAPDVAKLASELSILVGEEMKRRDIACVELVRRFSNGYFSPNYVMCHCPSVALSDQWSTAVLNGIWCDDSLTNSHKSLLESAGRQCGQWCVFDVSSRELRGWSFNGHCFSSFEQHDECARKWTHLKPTL